MLRSPSGANGYARALRRVGAQDLHRVGTARCRLVASRRQRIGVARLAGELARWRAARGCGGRAGVGSSHRSRKVSASAATAGPWSWPARRATADVGRSCRRSRRPGGRRGGARRRGGRGRGRCRRRRRRRRRRPRDVGSRRASGGGSRRVGPARRGGSRPRPRSRLGEGEVLLLGEVDLRRVRAPQQPPHVHVSSRRGPRARARARCPDRPSRSSGSPSQSVKCTQSSARSEQSTS